MSDIAQLQEALNSVRREGALIDRYIEALRLAGSIDGVTKEEALSATQRFGALVAKSAEADALAVGAAAYADEDVELAEQTLRLASEAIPEETDT